MGMQQTYGGVARIIAPLSLAGRLIRWRVVALLLLVRVYSARFFWGLDWIAMGRARLLPAVHHANKRLKRRTWRSHQKLLRTILFTSPLVYEVEQMSVRRQWQ